MRRRLLAFGVAAGLAVSGCEALAGPRGSNDRADLVGDLSARLGRAAELTYTAEYQLAGGTAATVANATEPPRSAYTYATGKIVFLPDMIILCRTTGATTTCTRTARPSPDAGLSPDVVTALREQGLIPASVVVDLLNATALDSDATVDQRDTTIAGQHATCIRVDAVDNAAAAAFEACVTTDGVLGSFTGTVSGTRIDLAMTGYRATVSPNAFDLPDGARVLGGTP